jgi:hypothetical protein
VQLKIYDSLGREVAALVDRHIEPGEYNVKCKMGNYQAGYIFID